jgi:Fe(3+) dicitrate transport protein
VVVFLSPLVPVGAEAGQFRGVVTDSTGAAVPGVEVVLSRPAIGFRRVATTDVRGRFEVAAPEGSYEASVSAPGFTRVLRSVDLSPDLEAKFILAPGAISESVTVVGTRIAGSAETRTRLPGSTDVVEREDLESSVVFNVNEALRKSSGVVVRDEEGFALRPNIGIRGLNPTRSTKTLLLEDGLFLTYAPYGDNASYYHPPVERFEGIEVLKGSGQIVYGPVTVGGIVNYLTPEPPERASGSLRLLGGNRGFGSARGTLGGAIGRTSALLEGLRKQGDGARDHMNFAVDDWNLKVVSRPSPAHRVTLKGSVYREDSQVTYSGLTRAEYEADPFQNPFVNDGFEGLRRGVSLKHSWAMSRTLVTTQAYMSDFHRDWWRQSSNSAQRPNDAADPNCRGLANLLTTCGNEGRLRDYVHFGVEPRLSHAHAFFGNDANLEIGARIHFEEQERLQVNGDTPLARTGRLVEDNRRENRALSAFAQQRVRVGSLTATVGLRFESIHYARTNRLANSGLGAFGETRVDQWVPGIGLSWEKAARLNLFAGLHRGFAPPRTEDIVSQTGGVVDLDAEKSWSLEVGARTAPFPGVRADFTLFRSDYENQIVPASVAGGVGATLTNGGETLHQGFEGAVRFDSGTLWESVHNVFLRAAFTVVGTARFEGARRSSVPGFSTVGVSFNRLPYAREVPDVHARLWARGRRLRAGRGGVRLEPVHGRSQHKHGLPRRTARSHPIVARVERLRDVRASAGSTVLLRDGQERVRSPLRGRSFARNDSGNAKERTGGPVRALLNRGPVWRSSVACSETRRRSCTTSRSSRPVVGGRCSGTLSVVSHDGDDDLRCSCAAGLIG